MLQAREHTLTLLSVVFIFRLAVESIKELGRVSKEMLYNWTDRASMFISKADIPFRAAKEIHHVTIQAVIDVCSKIESSIVDLFASTSLCFSSKNSFTIFALKFLFDHLSPCRQHY